MSPCLLKLSGLQFPHLQNRNASLFSEGWMRVEQVMSLRSLALGEYGGSGGLDKEVYWAEEDGNHCLSFDLCLLNH